MDEYYLIKNSDFDELKSELSKDFIKNDYEAGKFFVLSMLSDEKGKLIDLSDEAIIKKAKKESFAFTSKNGETFESKLAENYYSSALKDLKQTI